MPLIDLSALPLVALQSMNDVHVEEIGIVNELSDLIDAFDGSNEARSNIDTKFRELVAHTKDHFSGEEEKMIAGGFPALPMHQGEHERQLGVVASVVHRWEEHGDVTVLGQFIQRDLPPWVVQHINTMDTITAQFLQQTGAE